MLICGENTNPLARFALMAQGEQVHISSFPPVWPAHDPRDAAAYDVSDAILIRVRNHAFEGKLFNIVASAYMDEAMLTGLTENESNLARILRDSPRCVSLVVGPLGNVLGEPMQDDEGILYADVDLALTVAPRQLQDVAGYYNRFDVFTLTVGRTPNRPASFVGDGMRIETESAADTDEIPRIAKS